MKCKRCNTDNDKNNRFCRNCGSPLWENLSIPELFPEHNFKPTTVYKLPGEKKWLLPFIILLLLEGFICVMGIACFIIRTFEENDPFWGISGIIIAVILFLVILKMLKYSSHRYRKRNLQSVADYVETSPAIPGNYIVVKNSKFGLYNITKMQITIPCEHTYLSFLNDATYMAEKDDIRYRLDMYNNQLN